MANLGRGCHHKLMGSPGKKWNSLFQNYLAFLSAHRGTVTSLNDTVQVESEKKEFTYLVPGAKAPHPNLLKKFSTLQLTPWSFRPEEGYPDFKEKDEVSYISLTGNILRPSLIPGFEIRLVENKADMYAFSDVQCRGLMDNSPVYEEWAPFLHRANEINLGANGQYFYLGLLNAKPIAATHALDAAGVTGIYGIATLPEGRKKGFAHFLLAKISEEATLRGSEALTLQVAKDSYGETYFKKLGFEREFTAQVLERSVRS